jgi:3-methyladenine DNA glycosylase AlkD
MDARAADRLGGEIAALLADHRLDEAEALLAPVLAERTPFHYLDRVGRAVGGGPTGATEAFLDRLAARAVEGVWPVIGSALGQWMGWEPAAAMARCRAFIAQAGVWYGADILAERVPGPALVASFDAALPLLAPWRADDDRWVRRAVGVAVHFWAKRAQGADVLAPQAEALLAFLEPMFEEWQMDAAKGVGWGLKTLGRHYPDLMAAWLYVQIVVRGRRHRALMRRKALTHLPADQRARVTGER